MEKCRLCLSQCPEQLCLSECREGLSLSVIAMIICPIKIDPNDHFSKKICEECCNILCAAYRLREKSCESDRYFRKCEDGELKVEIVVKEEKIDDEEFDAENSVFLNPEVNFDDESEDEDSFRVFTVNHRTRKNKFIKSQEPSGRNFTVVNLKHNAKSAVWQFYGALGDASTGAVIDDSFHFCRLCVENGDIKKYYKTIATSTLMMHINKFHGINATLRSRSYEMPRANDEDCESFLETGLFFCDKCGASFKSKNGIYNHILKHLGSQTIPFNENFFVQINEKKKSSKSWDYFGRLVDKDGREVREGVGYNYCKICSEKGLTSRFKNTCSSSAMFSHLSKKHGMSRQDLVKASKRFTLMSSREMASDESQGAWQLLEGNVEFGTVDDSKIYIGHRIHCETTSSENPTIWNFLGTLVDISGNLVDAGKEFWFCKLCYEKYQHFKQFNRRHSTKPAIEHLKTIHGISSSSIKPDDEYVEGSKLQKIRERTCAQCCETFENRKAYSVHYRKVHNSNPFMCEICSKTYTANYLLQRHIKKVHTKPQIYNCSYCPKQFSYVEGLRKHEMRHDPKNNRRFQCDLCERFFSDKQTLHKHVLKIHMKQPEKKTYRCVDCDKCFSTPFVLSRHSLIHTGERPHQCQYCEATFTQKGDMMRHMQKNHVGDALYPCTIENCNQSFRFQAELRDHYRVHFKGEEQKEKI